MFARYSVPRKAVACGTPPGRRPGWHRRCPRVDTRAGTAFARHTRSAFGRVPRKVQTTRWELAVVSAEPSPPPSPNRHHGAGLAQTGDRWGRVDLAYPA